MKIAFGGVRGTSVTADPRFSRFGGDTTAFRVEGAGGEVVLVDAGTGLRSTAAGLEGKTGREILMLLTHCHLDHVMGFPSFQLLYRNDRRLVIAAPEREGYTVKDVVPGLMAKPLWPLQVESLAAPPEFRTLPPAPPEGGEPFGSLAIRWCPVHHPDGCTAYRFDEPATGAALVIATDVEWQEATEAERAAFEALCASPKPPDLLVADGHFAPRNYTPFRGWGHSTWQDSLDVARAVGAGRLLLTHHAPEQDDAALFAIEGALSGAQPDTSLAREGMVVVVEAP